MIRNLKFAIYGLFLSGTCSAQFNLDVNPSSIGAKSIQTSAIGIGELTYMDCSNNCGGQTGIEQKLYRNIDLFVFPNPSSGLFQITHNASQKFELKIYTVMGEEIYSEEIYSKETEIDLSNYSNGIYFLQIKNAQESSTMKIQLQSL